MRLRETAYGGLQRRPPSPLGGSNVDAGEAERVSKLTGGTMRGAPAHRARPGANTTAGSPTRRWRITRSASPPRAPGKWSALRVANTALGAISFLALEAIGGRITLAYGFTNSVAAILSSACMIFAISLPICVLCGAGYGVDIDLLTRGAGFGYIGSTITSLIYASFTFIFFAHRSRRSVAAMLQNSSACRSGSAIFSAPSWWCRWSPMASP